MKRKLFFAFSALLDEIGLDPKDIIKSFSKTFAEARTRKIEESKKLTKKKKDDEKEVVVDPELQEAMFSVIYIILTKIHNAKTTYIPFVVELYGCTEEEAEEKDVEDVLKWAFTNGEVKAFFTSGARLG